MQSIRELAFERRFRMRVLGPGALILLVTTLICALGLLSAGAQVDKLSLAGQRYEAYRAIGRGLDEVSLGQEAVAVCDGCEAEARSPHPDLHWLDENVGFWLFDVYHAHESFILDARNRPVYGAIARRRVAPAAFGRIAPAVRPFLDLVRGVTRRPNNLSERLPSAPVPTGSSVRTSPRAIHATDLARVGGRVAIVSVMRMVPLRGARRGHETTTPLLVNIRYLDQAFFADVARQNFIARPTLRDTGPLAPGESAIPLRDSRNAPLSRFVWIPLRPGSVLIHAMLPFAAGAVACVAGLLLALALQLRRLMRRDFIHVGELEAAHLELQASEAQAHHLAYHDALTGLPNRALFNNNVDVALSRVRHGASAAILLLDLDRFKNVNDRFGHLAGDQLIEEVARRLGAIMGGVDAVARLGGDEFAILLQLHAPHVGAIRGLLDRILTDLRKPFNVLGNQAHIGVSIGVAIAPGCGIERTELMRKADIALYRAKAEGRDCFRFFSDCMDETVQLRATLEADLRQALDSGHGLSVHYQPQMDAGGRQVTGLEALVRWQHPLRGAIPPTLFVPVAEETGLILALGEWVLREACTVARQWPHIPVAVNLSPVQLRTDDFATRLAAIVRAAGVASHQIELEVTEGVLLDDDDAVRLALRQLRAEGFRIALDDFGTGYSSLSYLRQFEVDKIKIDRSFVQHLGQSGDAAAIVNAVVTLGHAMGLCVTAEGVETDDQKDFLSGAGCNQLQGFLFSRPVPATEIAAMMRRPPTIDRIDQRLAAAA